MSLLISDLGRSLEYYGQILGFRVIDRKKEWARLGVPDAPDCLIELRQGARSPAPAARVPRFGLFHFALLLPDRTSLGRFLRHLRAGKVPFSSADHAVSEAIYLWDPDGLGIEVYADRPRELWQTRGQELVMTTEPLDLDSLMKAGADGLWPHAPGGTRMGHVHLNVGDLGAAEAFYHRALGLDKVVWSYPGALFLSAGGYHHHLATNTWARGAVPRGENEPGLVVWELQLPSDADAEAAAASIAAQGFSVMREESGAVAEDPWGTRVCLASG